MARRARAPLRLALLLLLTLASVWTPLRAAAGLPVEICAADGPRLVILDPATGAPVDARDAACERCILCAALLPLSAPASVRSARCARCGRPAPLRSIGLRAIRARRARAPPSGWRAA